MTQLGGGGPSLVTSCRHFLKKRWVLTYLVEGISSVRNGDFGNFQWSQFWSRSSDFVQNLMVFYIIQLKPCTFQQHIILWNCVLYQICLRTTKTLLAGFHPRHEVVRAWFGLPGMDSDGQRGQLTNTERQTIRLKTMPKNTQKGPGLW